ncbi:transporter [Anaerostipes sp. 992a]|uniref:energy-coupling factor transporter transmembrane component T family protein n=1 Tax=Anaerostipes sp. 992a TaxID=1261637 RepID=UPI0009533ECD|nr:energy-coupling factor transporter transmembrane component T [Anaerostipes sp. 992a]OLR62967.1 transporter [Anaerostipes sp. 992a]
MIREITLGQYYKGNSFLHRLDPRTKVAGTVLYIISLFIGKSIAAYLLAGVFLAVMVKISTVPFSYMVRGLKAVFTILIFSVVLNMFFIPGEVIVDFGFCDISREGLQTAVFMAIRLVFLILGSSLMTLTTTPNQLTDGMEKLLKPLKKLKIPVHEISMMMAIALRFIPILTEELDKIMKAQMARGAEFDQGNLIQKVKSVVPILVPLFVSAVRRANDLAMAMESRCYHGGEGRTKMKPLIYEQRDYIAYAIVGIYLAVMIGMRVIR